MLKLQKLFQRMQNQKGAAKIEYVLLVALISVAAIPMLQGIGTKVVTQFTEIDTALT